MQIKQSLFLHNFILNFIYVHALSFKLVLSCFECFLFWLHHVYHYSVSLRAVFCLLSYLLYYETFKLRARVCVVRYIPGANKESKYESTADLVKICLLFIFPKRKTSNNASKALRERKLCIKMMKIVGFNWLSICFSTTLIIFHRFSKRIEKFPVGSYISHWNYYTA